MARPTDYAPALCEAVEALLADGKSLTAAAGEMGIHRDTAYAWMDAHPEFSDAIKRGRAKGVSVWEDRLQEMATKGGGNATALIFAMKNLYREDWNDRTSHEHTGKDGEAIKTEEVGQGAAKLAAFVAALAERS